MGCSPSRGRLLCTLNELGEDELGRFKVKLADMGQKGGYNPIPWGRLGRAKPAEMAAELINHYGVRGGLETAGEVLRAIRRGELAGGLAEAVKAGVRNPESEPRSELESDARGEHFVDRHRAELIQRVSMVDGVLDMLCGTVLDNEQYQSIRAERSNPEKMRKLYELMPSWNRVCKDRLYQALKAKHTFLIEELEGK
uniref:Apoptosis-associated speck-like protein containing a CARD n=1 Tax=Chelydra serpentina TaxID=8475 RepID=A0A8C3XSX1_CHESE